MTSNVPDRETKLIVAAIDFGTTYSGYAYSWYHEYKRDPLQIHANRQWSSPGGGLVTWKTPTIVLFHENKGFHSFGFEAESKYADLAQNNEHIGWRYFRRFKMELSGKVNREDRKIKDDQGKKMAAIDVFSASIKYLKGHLWEQLNLRNAGICEEDIHWIITVPAIWQDGAKQFMIKAAENAGIPECRLALALEPEAAAIYCKALSLVRGNDEMLAFDAGKQFMVLDLGGGTVDITIHEVEPDYTLKELHSPSGGPWGGVLVDREFMSLMSKLFDKHDTVPIMSLFGQKNKEAMVELLRSFEIVKRTVTGFETSPTFRSKIGINIPHVLYKLFKKEHKEDLESYLVRTEYVSTIEKKDDKLLIHWSILKDMFEQSKDKLVDHLKSLLNRLSLARLDTLIMVGGFSESKVMTEAVKNAFPKMRVIVPEEAGLAVVKGAVMYGHNKDVIRSRKMAHTYGISVRVPFSDEHPPTKRTFLKDGSDQCEDIFKIFVRAGDSVKQGQTSRTHTFNWPYTFTIATIEVYKTLSPDPQFVTDEGCEKVGDIDMKLEENTANTVDVVMIFGGTELKVEARETDTDNVVSSTFNCLH